MKRRRRAYRAVGPFTNIYREPGAWAVRVLRGGKYHVGHFADATYGGKRKALIAARRFRDQLFKRIEPDTRVRRKVPKGSRSETDRVGVAFEEYIVHGRVYERFIAHWQDADGRHRRRSFGIGAYGRRGAFARAVEARNKGIAHARAMRRARQLAEANERLAAAPPQPRQVKDPRSRKGIRMRPRDSERGDGKNRSSVRTGLVTGPGKYALPS
jgi:hypothetical protein